MFFKKKDAPSPLHTTMRRRFNHLLLKQRKQRNRSVPSSGLSQPRRRRSRRLASPFAQLLSRLFLLLGGIAVVIGTSYLVFFSTIFTVKKVTVEKPGQAIPVSSLQPFLDKLKGRNILFLRTDTLTDELAETFKHELLLAKIKKSYPNQVVLSIEEYPAVLQLHVIAPEGESFMTINQTGYVIAQGTTRNEALPLLSLKSDEPLVIDGNQFVQKEKLYLMTRGFNRFQELFGMKVISGEWKKIERELHLTTEKGFVVWLDLTSDIDKQLDKLKRALDKLDIYNEPLSYIDLRIAGAKNEKVIFKRK
ncbi:hypothetical protein CO046_03785 [Candidatus Peregrinibacteria bacterium CG_4_9_14_0_2_um_filter_53_11]|nr:MAG: hypothetical protein CO046_03785 [Candidatus Peregrinibacteria bacterium CG_4_9_14_0_2_um_filter_53_11]